MISFDSLNRFDRFAECALIVLFFNKMGQTWPLFVSFLFFSPIARTNIA